MEDDECLLENDPLAIYLKTQQLRDFETATIHLQKVSKSVSVVNNQKIIPCNYEECHSFIEQILTSELLLEEDNIFLVNFNSTHVSKAKDCKVNKIIFYSTLPLIGYGICRYASCFFSNILFPLSTVPLLFNLYYLAKRELKIRRVTLLLRELRNMTKLSRKSLSTVAEYSATLGYYSANSINSSSLNYMYIRFAQHFYSILLNMINSLAYHSTLICSLVPLSIENHIKYSPKEDLFTKDEVNLTDLRNIFELYLLVQSDFLKSLALSFCKYLWLDCGCDNSKVFSDVLPSLTSTFRCNLSTLEKELSLLLKFGTSETCLARTPRKIKDLPITYMTSCLHNAEINFHQLFCKCRDLQELLNKAEDVEQADSAGITILLNEMDKQLIASKNTVETVTKYYNQRQNLAKEDELELPSHQCTADCSIPKTVESQEEELAKHEKLSYELYIPKEGLEDLTDLEVDSERTVFSVKDVDYCGCLLEELRTTLKSRNPDVFEEEEQDKNIRKNPINSDEEDSSYETRKPQVLRPTQPFGLAENLQSIDHILATRKTMRRVEDFVEETFGNSDSDSSC